MANRRNGRPRLKFAILDTGVNDDDPWLFRALDDAKQARETQDFSGGDHDTNPIVAHWPSEEEARDDCGHGTNVAYFLLRFAPDADLCIAKVSEGMTRDDYDKVVDAIDWAVSQDVDIINMSFWYADGRQDN